MASNVRLILVVLLVSLMLLVLTWWCFEQRLHDIDAQIDLIQNQ